MEWVYWLYWGRGNQRVYTGCPETEGIASGLREDYWGPSTEFWKLQSKGGLIFL